MVTYGGEILCKLWDHLKFSLPGKFWVPPHKISPPWAGKFDVITHIKVSLHRRSKMSICVVISQTLPSNLSTCGLLEAAFQCTVTCKGENAKYSLHYEYKMHCYSAIHTDMHSWMQHQRNVKYVELLEKPLIPCMTVASQSLWHSLQWLMCQRWWNVWLFIALSWRSRLSWTSSCLG